MDETVSTIVHGDCIAGLNALAEGSVDLVFADPPFNIGYDYDVYRDELGANEYLTWSREWISAVHRALSPTGTFWLAIGDEYAAELKIESQRIGFFPRSWVVWYYTFGVNCIRKFTRSHVHLFHFVKDRKEFTFRAAELENRVPSARQLVYNDIRGNPDGRLPDDTWIIPPANTDGEMIPDDAVWTIGRTCPPEVGNNTFTLRPQDLEGQFVPNESTWYFPRVAGTFKERAGFHGCQMPEQLLGRIVRVCSNEGELVVDPFSGSATTLAVAKKLGRRYLGFDISKEYVSLGRARLESIRVGDRLEGSAEPTMSAPKTQRSPAIKAAKRGAKSRGRNAVPFPDPKSSERVLADFQSHATRQGIVEAFRRIHNGYSPDRIVADPELNEDFAKACRRLGILGDPRFWNSLLFRLRKRGALAAIPTTKRTDISWEDCDSYLFASEIALQKMLYEGKAKSLDEILCDPVLAREFDERAHGYAAGRTPLEYRWAALKLRKQAKVARTRGAALNSRERLHRLSPPQSLENLDILGVPARPGVYLLAERAKKLYVGGALNLRSRFALQFDRQRCQDWTREYSELRLQLYMPEVNSAEMLAWQSCFVQRYKPALNFQELCRP